MFTRTLKILRLAVNPPEEPTITFDGSDVIENDEEKIDQICDNFEGNSSGEVHSTSVKYLSLDNAGIEAGVQIKIDQSILVTNEIPESKEEPFDSDDSNRDSNFIPSKSSNEENILENKSNPHKNNGDQNVEADQEATNKKKENSKIRSNGK
ncbi:hypothetical protein ILUMI_12090 [Ignelater luminosus]|uniref:Uncharacterized protein n=1 Tax=Ignelater luminosus TaxID=2038154 RepID=A0A8K0CUV9_IGNLU|nr:hypothetical protein ILUMI_12090 [Ignelater luminosus]